MKEPSNDRSWGTALFLSHNSRRYLLTARHVVFDEDLAEIEFQKRKESVLSSSSSDQQRILGFLEEEKQNRIFNRIFRVPSLDEFQSNLQVDIKTLKVNPGTFPKFLHNLMAGTYSSAPYTFSNSGVDLAIISLDNRDTRFAEELLNMGYMPISSNDIGDKPTQEGSDVFTVGFPSSVAKFGKLLDYSEWDYAISPYFSLPNFSFGKVSMLHMIIWHIFGQI